MIKQDFNTLQYTIKLLEISHTWNTSHTGILPQDALISSYKR